MRIYIDNCCFNRPYDSQSSFRISLETRAKLFIQDEVKQGRYDMVTSYMLEYENAQNTDIMKRNAIKEFQDKYCCSYVSFDRRTELQTKIDELMSFNLSYKDATHAACAIYANCRYLLTTDDRFKKRYKGHEICILNPLEFIRLIGEEETE